MRIKRFLSVRKIVALAFSLLLMSQSMSVYASDLDALVGSTEESAVVTESPATTTTEGTSSSSVYKDDGSDALLDALSGTQNITSESMEKASRLTAPFIAFMNLVCSVLILLLIGAIGVITVLDLIFIGIPPVRRFLYPMFDQLTTGNVPAGGGMMPMGGGYGGFGSRYGYGGMGMQMGGQQAQPSKIRHQWVSDEAVQCIGLSAPQPQMQQPMGMGMGMGMMQQQPQQPQQGKSVIIAYLKKRTVFLVVFVFAVMFLTSSILTGFGLKLFSFVSEGVSKFL